MRFSHALRLLIASLGLGAATSGCYYATDNGNPPPVPAENPDLESIDTGATMSVSAGHGAGLFVEYLGNGAWSVYTSCDTLETERDCEFDVIFAVAEGVTISAPTLNHDPEADDRLVSQSSGSFRLFANTQKALDGVSFNTDAGAAIQIDMLLDGQARPELINWISGATHVAGTTTNPVNFLPTAP